MMGIGYTWEQVDDFDLPRVYAVYRGWRRHPPTHWLMASYVGYKPPPSAEPGAAAAGPKPQELFSSLGNQLLDG
jgi:hypothetical protein